MDKRIGGLVSVLVTALPVVAEAAKLLVAMNGTDGPTCGATVATACRTISRAIANARPGDTVEVGPGRYGDLNQDGSLAGVGEEAGQVDTGCDCVVHVSKRCVVVSRLGAKATVIDAVGAFANVVRIAESGTTFGKRGKGFTVTGSGDGRGLDSSAEDLAIGGNVFVANASHGLRLSGDRAVVVGNTAADNGGSGFQLDGARSSVIRGNVALHNGADGFNQVNAFSLVAGNVSLGNDEDGFDQQGEDVVYQGNAALANGGSGFDLNACDRTVVVGALAHGNRRGIEVDGSDTVITKSSIVGNVGVGIDVQDGGRALVVSKTNVFGNNAAPDPIATNCGVTSLSGGPLALATVYWGAASGPGADPADELCLLVPHGGLVTAPPATKEMRVKPPR
ncbi:MAG: right-handed parallel beta-helix repeat-containing protein [Deltaproteobacteria bacterium]|nr:right-handed parallel beta-helix repeat-containing protein [Deltaproteobacteria bacterium]